VDSVLAPVETLLHFSSLSWNLSKDGMAIGRCLTG
jgi:hypothetical protein